MSKIDPKEVARRLAAGAVVRILRPIIPGCECAVSTECPFCHQFSYDYPYSTWSSYPLKLGDEVLCRNCSRISSVLEIKETRTLIEIKRDKEDAKV